MPQSKESQSVEFKRICKDEYIKWISAFANSEGGTLYVGRDDSGEVLGISNAKDLLSTIPNKVQSLLGVVPSVKLHKEKGKEYLAISVEHYPYPVSYKGGYFVRSGSSVQELKGSALDKFLLTKQGKRWDSVPNVYLKFKDLDSLAFGAFRDRASKRKRLNDGLLDESDEGLIEKLHLKDGEYFKQATTLLFAKEPQKYITGSTIKIGFFESNSELLYQDIIEGNLFAQVDKAMELVFSKYLKAMISYEGVQRIERYPVSELAFREALTNAVVHKDYGSGFDIQISIYNDRLMIWNAGDLPPHWDIQTLLQKHSSQPYNPTIAYPFFLAGYIESWGRGIEKIIDESKKFNGIVPQFRWQNGLWVEFVFNEKMDIGLVDGLVGKLVDGLVDTQKSMINLMLENPQISIKALAKELDISTTAIDKHIKALKNQGLIKRVGNAKSGHWEIVR